MEICREQVKFFSLILQILLMFGLFYLPYCSYTHYLIDTTYHGIWREQTRTERLLKNAKYVDKLKYSVLTELIVKT